MDWLGCILLFIFLRGGTLKKKKPTTTLYWDFIFKLPVPGIAARDTTFIKLPFSGASICVGGKEGGEEETPKAVGEKLRKFSALLKKQPVKVRLAMLLLFPTPLGILGILL